MILPKASLAAEETSAKAYLGSLTYHSEASYDGKSRSGTVNTILFIQASRTYFPGPVAQVNNAAPEPLSPFVTPTARSRR
ncbi:hypothetical protein VTL71DRAFT_352, partial [Oculimacula yallundae]